MAGEHAAATRGPGRSVGTMIYAFVPGDVEPTDEAHGVGDPPGPVAVVDAGDVAALVSEVPLDRPLGRPSDLTAYQSLVDGTAAVAPVVPVRFGTVLTDPDAVRELLANQHDNLVALLDALEDRVEFVLHGRYRESVVLTEILDENAEARSLRDQIQGQPDEVTINVRMRLGEIINQTVEAKRAADGRYAMEVLAPVGVRLIAREPTHELDAVNLAVLVDRRRQDEFDSAAEALAGTWEGRVTLRRLGPLAAYDFVPPLQAGA